MLSEQGGLSWGSSLLLHLGDPFLFLPHPQAQLCSRLLHARRLTCTAHFSGLPDTTSPHLCKRRSPGTVVECLAQRLVPGTALWPAVPQPGCQPSAAASPGRSAGAAGEGRREREPQLSTRPAAITSVHICEFRTPVTLQANPGFPRINPMN